MADTCYDIPKPGIHWEYKDEARRTGRIAPELKKGINHFLRDITGAMCDTHTSAAGASRGPEMKNSVHVYMVRMVHGTHDTAQYTCID
jgi:hypothetical protein